MAKYLRLKILLEHKFSFIIHLSRSRNKRVLMRVLETQKLEIKIFLLTVLPQTSWLSLILLCLIYAGSVEICKWHICSNATTPLGFALVFFLLVLKCLKYFEVFCRKVDFIFLMHNFPKWSDTLWKSCNKCCKIFKVCLTILRYYALKVY